MNGEYTVTVSGTICFEIRSEGVATRARLARARSEAGAPLRRTPEALLADFRDALIAMDTDRANRLKTDYLAAGGSQTLIMEATRAINPSLVQTD